MIAVYIAGAYTGPDVLSVLGNMRRGIDLAMDAAEAGLCPETPWLDFQYGLKRDWPLKMYQDIGLEKLKRCDAMLLVPG